MNYRSGTKWLSAFSLAVLAASAASANRVPAVADTAHSSVLDEKLQATVEKALQCDSYFYAAHMNVSVKNGNVLLRGFVFSDWDLRDAIRIATKAAGGRRVIDDLSIEVAGRR